MNDERSDSANPPAFASREAKITVRPPQFGLRTLLAAAAGIALTFGVLGWFEVSAAVGFFVLGVLVVAALATAGLLAALLQAYTEIGSTAGARPADREEDSPFEPPPVSPANPGSAAGPARTPRSRS